MGGRYPGRTRTAPDNIRTDQAQGNEMATAHVTAHTFLNTVAAYPISPGPIHPTNITLPTKHKAFRHMMTNMVNKDITAQLREHNRSSLVTVDEDTDGINEDQWAEITHFAMTQYGYKAALRRFADGAETAVQKELLQIHNRDAFAPQFMKALTPEQRRRALESIVMVKQKRDDSLKGRLCADGRKQRGTMRRTHGVWPQPHVEPGIPWIHAHSNPGQPSADQPGYRRIRPPPATR